MKQVFLILSIYFGPLFISTGFSQSNVSKTITQIVKDTREGKIISISLEPLFIPINISQSIEELKPYAKDSSIAVKYQALSLIYSLGQKSNDLSTRQKSINLLINGTQDLNPMVSEMAWKNLLTFPTTDFKGNPITVLNRYDKNSTHQPEMWAKTAGYLDLKSKIEEIKSLLEIKLSFKQKWQVHLALARLGEKNSIDYILNKLSRTEINDEWTNAILPDLAYTHSRSIFKFLFEAIQKKSNTCKSAHPDSNTPIPCSYRIIEQIAQEIINFPAKIDASGDIIGDYPKALRSTLDWINTDSNTYQFRN